jgi:hypothetical protein
MNDFGSFLTACGVLLPVAFIVPQILAALPQKAPPPETFAVATGFGFVELAIFGSVLVNHLGAQGNWCLLILSAILLFSTSLSLYYMARYVIHHVLTAPIRTVLAWDDEGDKRDGGEEEDEREEEEEDD